VTCVIASGHNEANGHWQVVTIQFSFHPIKIEAEINAAIAFVKLCPGIAHKFIGLKKECHFSQHIDYGSVFSTLALRRSYPGIMKDSGELLDLQMASKRFLGTLDLFKNG
jgi:hypothetical protein